MRAIVLDKFGGLDSLVYKDIAEPEPKTGHVVIQIKAFGINHAEMHMRRGEWAEAARSTAAMPNTRARQSRTSR
jgi:NADPH:quinone reductase